MSGMVTLDLRGELNMDAITAEIRKAAVRALLLALEHLLQVSRTMVPHQEGTLERSGQTDIDAHDLRGSVYYDTPYAVRQHEDQSLRHDDGRQAKYLENALTQEAAIVRAIVLHQLSAAIGG